MKYSLIILLIAFRCTLGGEELREVQLLSPATCGYDARSFFVYKNLGSVPYSLEEPLRWYYLGPHSREFGDTASLAFQSWGMIDQVLLLVNAQKPFRGSPPFVPLRRDAILLIAEYQFANSSDFLLAKYRVDLLNPIVYAAFTQGRTRAYVFGVPTKKESDPDSTVEVFNRMLSENPGTLNESPLCMAQMLVLFKFYAQFAPMIVPRNPEEALGYMAMLQAMAQRETPPYLRTFDDLYLSGIASDTLVAPFVRWNSGRLELAAQLKDLTPKDSALWQPPETITEKDRVTVLFTAANATLGDLARWRVVFVNGLVQSVEPVVGPYRGPVFEVCKDFKRCPFDFIPGWIRPHVDEFLDGL